MTSLKDSFKIAIDHGFIRSFDYSAFENCTIIASGAFGTVHKAYLKTIEKNVALKCLHSDDTMNNDFHHDFIRELWNINAVNYSDNIIKFMGVSLDHSTGAHYLVLEYAEDGNLRSCLRDNYAKLDWPTKIRMAHDIASGLNCIHEANIAHRDLHSKNILVHRGRLMIADLGLSKPLDVNFHNSASIAGGTIAYSDPQYLKNPGYVRHKSSDIYSLGVLLWELSSGRPPFDNKPPIQTLNMIIGGLRESHVNGTPIAYINIYTNAWEYDPTRRATIKQILHDLKNIQLEPVYYSPGHSSDASNTSTMDTFSRDTMSNIGFGYAGSLDTVGTLSRGIGYFSPANYDPSIHERGASGNTINHGYTSGINNAINTLFPGSGNHNHNSNHINNVGNLSYANNSSTYPSTHAKVTSWSKKKILGAVKNVATYAANDLARFSGKNIPSDMNLPSLPPGALANPNPTNVNAHGGHVQMAPPR